MYDIDEKSKLHSQPSPGFDESSEPRRKNNKVWLKFAAWLTIFMAVCQAIISISPASAANFQAPKKLLESRLSLFIMGESATLILVVFSLYALSGVGRIRRLPLLRIVLVVISILFLLRGLFIVFAVLEFLDILKGKILIQGVISHLVFLAAGIAFTGGTILNWRDMVRQKQV